MSANIGTQFDRVPATEAERTVEGRPTRKAILEYFDDRFGMDPKFFAPYTFWEKGSGKIWAFRGGLETPIPVEALGIHLLRTRQRFWKPTTDGIQLLGRHATRNVLVVEPDVASQFWAGETQAVAGEVDDGYVIVAQILNADPEPLGVGLYLDGELQSMIPKGRRRDLGPLPVTVESN